ncbi:MAG: DoxX family membrane protein [Gammaproteobacteria bacterium]|nr:DoxX family membrane protein [Gammaproteobacteria bacterium]
MRTFDRIARISSQAIELLEYTSPAMDLLVRLWLANVFWKAGLVKLSSWSTTVMLFSYEYQVPLLPPEVAAVLATAVELGGAALLALGLGARAGAIALFVLNATAVISYPELSEAGLRDHYFWGILLALYLVRGPGKLSFDHLIRTRYFKTRAG